MPAFRLWTPFGRAVHLRIGALVRIFDIRTNENMLKMLMCCIINIYPNELLEFLSATLYYMNCFINCQTNNTKCSSNMYVNKHGHSGIHWSFCQRYQTNNKLLNIVIWKYFFIRFRHKTLKIYAHQGCKMSSPAKGGSQPCGWQIASSRDSFCDFGRKLESLSMPVHNTVLCCHGRQHKS